MQALNDWIKEIRDDPNISTWNEAQAKEWIIRPILDLLGWGGREITPEYGVGARRVDYSLQADGDNEVFLEAKKPGEELENHQEQLLDYSFKEGVELAILTNSIFWWFYLPLKKGVWDDRKFYTIDILGQEIEDIVDKFDLLLSREHIASGKAVQHAESILESRQREERVKQALPEAWNSVIKEPHELLVEILIETVEEACDFKLENSEILRFMRFHHEKWLLSTEPEQEFPPPTTSPITTTESPNKNQTESPKRMQSITKDEEKPHNKITQDQLIPHILKILYDHGGRAPKHQVENKIYESLEDIFQHKWYQATVSHGIPKWKHDIAWAKQRAKDLHGFIKDPEESGRGIWELTQEGKKYYRDKEKGHALY